MTSADQSVPTWFNDIGRLRLAGYLEGATLITLLFVAVPLKHLAGMDMFVRILGPIHGGAFVLYFVCAVSAVSAHSFGRGGSARVVVAAVVPFGTFVNDGLLARMHREDAR